MIRPGSRVIAGRNRLPAILLLLIAMLGGCQSEETDPPPELRPGVYDVRIRFIDIQGSPRCFASGGYITSDTVCVSSDILDFAGIESCPLTTDEEDGHFDCLANVLWDLCPSEVRFDGNLDIVDAEHFLLFGIYEVDPADPGACQSNCQTRVSFEGKWLHSGRCP